MMVLALAGLVSCGEAAVETPVENNTVVVEDVADTTADVAEVVVDTTTDVADTAADVAEVVVDTTAGAVEGAAEATDATMEAIQE